MAQTEPVFDPTKPFNVIAASGATPASASPTSTAEPPPFDPSKPFTVATGHNGATADAGGAMNFAVVNGQRVPIDGLPDDIKTELRQHSEQGDVILQNLKDIGVVAKDFIIGGAKSLARSGIRGGELLRKIPGVDALANALPSIDVPVEPTNLTQKLGGYAEQAAEVIAPGRAITAAADAAVARVAPRLVGMVGETAANLAPRVAVEAAANAGLSAAQGGDARVGAVLGAAGPIVGQVARSLIPPLRAGAAKKVTQALGGQKERYKAIAERLTPEILRRGLGGSREGLLAQAAEKLSTVGQDLDTALTGHGTKQFAVSPVISALEKAKDAFRVTNPTTGEIVSLEPRALQQLDGLQKVITAVGPDATVENLTAVKRAWDSVVSQAGGFAHRAGGAIGVPLKDQSEAWAKREGAGAIRKLLADALPDVAAINKEWSFWKGLSDVLTQTLQRTQPQGPGLGRVLAEGAGQIVGGVAGTAAGPAGAFGGAFAAGKLAKQAEAAFASPRWQFVDANLRNRLADALARGAYPEIASTLGRITAVTGSKAAVSMETATRPR